MTVPSAGGEGACRRGNQKHCRCSPSVVDISFPLGWLPTMSLIHSVYAVAGMSTLGSVLVLNLSAVIQLIGQDLLLILPSMFNRTIVPLHSNL